MSNRLNRETSPYLLQHAGNPVEWYPWSDEALSRAKEEDKPIFLSIGYAACHWCHVMAHESFEDPETAKIMNDYFINIKVDREERPDLDSIYMDAVVAVTGHGGWPMSVFLTPDGKPFHGGTYFPPTPRFNMPSFQDVLTQIHKLWQEDRPRLNEIANQLTERVGSVPQLLPEVENLDPNIHDRAVEALFRLYDWKDGGWGRAPKFPQSMIVEYLFRYFHRSGEKLALDMATHALNSMAKGGMYDLIGGGFHRYSVDDQWLVPHFEKMLYDNALLIRAYLYAWQITQDPALLQVVHESLTFLKREMLDESGGFYSSIDADSEGEEGKYYLWSLQEIQEALPDPKLKQLAIMAFGISEAGNFEGKNIPTLVTTLPELSTEFHLSTQETIELLNQAKGKLIQFRNHKVRPGLDDKILTAWNGLMLSTFSLAARILGSHEEKIVAQNLGRFLLDELLSEGGLKRSWRQGSARYTAYLEDHAALGLGLLDLYQLDFDTRWYSEAVNQAEQILSHFKDPNGGFFDTRDDHEKLITRPKSIHDSPIPSANSLAISFLLRLAALTGNSKFSDPAEAALKSMQESASQHPSAFPAWLCEIDFALGPQYQLAIIGEPDTAPFLELKSIADQRYLPNMIIAGGHPGTSDQPELLDGRQLLNRNPTAYLCQRFTCKLPTNSPDILEEQLTTALANLED